MVKHAKFPDISPQPLPYVAPVPFPLAQPPPSCTVPFPLGSLIDNLTRPPPSCVTFIANSNNPPDANMVMPNLSTVTHLVASPRIYGLCGDGAFYVKVCIIDGKLSRLIDGGSNVCVTGDLHHMVDVVNIEPIPILVALEGAFSTFEDCITKWCLLPLTPTDGTPYYQPCFYCANMVKTIISPTAGCK
jgi:hypothetical protein